jgi:chemotaxis signal transduction protein
MTDEVSRIYARLDTLEEEMMALRRELVVKLAGVQTSEAELSVLECRAARQRFGLLLGGVDVVVPMAQLLPLPETAPWILGSLNYHGRNIVVLDVAYRLAEAPHVIAPTELIVICSTEWRQVGLLVEEVLDVLSIEANAVKDPAPGVRFASFLAGVIDHEFGSLPLIEVSRLAAESLSAEEIER